MLNIFEMTAVVPCFARRIKHFQKNPKICPTNKDIGDPVCSPPILHGLFPLSFPDPVWEGPVSGGGWEADSEADHWFGAGHPVLVSANKQGQQRRGSAAPRYRHDRPGHPKNQTRSVRKDQRWWNGDCAAPHRADHGQSPVIMMLRSKHSELASFALKWLLGKSSSLCL